MKKTVILFTILLTSTLSIAQADKMTNNKLDTIISKISMQVEGVSGNWQFVIDSTFFICLTDETHNRMRIISPVIESSKLTENQLIKCMEANFHTVLDSRYAISDGWLWSAFIHPLGELTEYQFLSAVSQVYSGAQTFGAQYSSGLLSFPKIEEAPKAEKTPKKQKKSIKKI